MLDTSDWTQSDFEGWASRPSEDRTRDVEKAYAFAKSVRPGRLNKKAWQSANVNFTRLVVCDAQVRAAEAADLVEGAITSGQVRGDQIQALIEEHGAGFLPSRIFALLYEDLNDEFQFHDWSGSGVDANDQAMRYIRCVEYIQNAIRVYLEDPPREEVSDPGGVVDEGLVSLLSKAKERLLSQAFRTPPDQEFRPSLV